MHKKIYICSIVFSAVSSFVFGMDQNHVLCKAMQKGIIPSLLINDFIVIVPNAYQALCKEVSLDQNILQMMVKERDERIKKFMQKVKDNIIHRSRNKKMIEEHNNVNFDLTHIPHSLSLEEEHSLFHVNDMDYKPNCCNIMIPFYAMLFGITIVTAGFLGVIFI